MKILYILLICSVVLVGCNSNKIVNIEDNNSYLWQRYMNEEEFNKLQKGLTYMDVVEIAGGEGEIVEEQQDQQRIVYVWNDEILITKAYELTFVNDQLDAMEIVELKGTSDRTIEEKKPAVPASP